MTMVCIHCLTCGELTRVPEGTLLDVINAYISENHMDLILQGHKIVLNSINDGVHQVILHCIDPTCQIATKTATYYVTADLINASTLVFSSTHENHQFEMLVDNRNIVTSQAVKQEINIPVPEPVL
jgi:hypothetical protein